MLVTAQNNDGDQVQATVHVRSVTDGSAIVSVYRTNGAGGDPGAGNVTVNYMIINTY